LTVGLSRVTGKIVAAASAAGSYQVIVFAF
jgi:hypothetical protein